MGCALVARVGVCHAWIDAAPSPPWASCVVSARHCVSTSRSRTRHTHIHTHTCGTIESAKLLSANPIMTWLSSGSASAVVALNSGVACSLMEARVEGVAGIQSPTTIRSSFWVHAGPSGSPSLSTDAHKPPSVIINFALFAEARWTL